MLYATNADVAKFMYDDEDHAVPDNTFRLIRTASNLVSNEIMGARYATTSEGLPTDPRIIVAVRDATCEQVSAWLTSGIDPARGVDQLKAVVASRSALGVSVSFDNGSKRAAAEVLAKGERVIPAAWDYLNRAGLINGNVSAAGAVGDYVGVIGAFDPITGRYVG